MSLVFEGNARELRFSGPIDIAPVELVPEVVDPFPTPEPLGRPRQRRPKHKKAVAPAADMRYSPWPGGAWNVSTREVERRKGNAATSKDVVPKSDEHEPSVARKLGELAQRFPHSLRRLNALPPPAAPSAAPDGRPAPIPLFRTPEQVQPQAVAAPVLAGRARRPSLAVWLVASVVVGLVSYQVASHVISRFQGSTVTAAR